MAVDKTLKELNSLLDDIAKELPTDKKADRKIDKDLRYELNYYKTLAKREPRITQLGINQAYHALNKALLSYEAPSKEEVIIYRPTDPNNPGDPKDKNIPTIDKQGRPIEKISYNVVGLATDGDGTIEGREAIGLLVKHGLSYEDLLENLELVGKDGADFWKWQRLDTEIKTETIPHGFQDRAIFIRSGKEVGSGVALPPGYQKFTINRYESVADHEGLGRVFAIKRGEKVPVNLLPPLSELEPTEGYEDVSWNFEMGDRALLDTNPDHYKDFLVTNDITFLARAKLKKGQ